MAAAAGHGEHACMTRLADIQTPHWQPRLGGDGVAQDLDDIGQAIRVILATPKGSDPLRPQFGSNVHKYLDYPIDRARPHVVRETVEAIQAWETRVSVVRVVVGLAEESALRVRVVWAVAGGVQGETSVRVGQ